MPKQGLVDTVRHDELFHAVLHEDRYIVVRGLLIAVILTGLIPVFKTGFYFGCELMLLQAILLPFAMTALIVGRSNTPNRRLRTLRGGLAGALTGGIPLTISAVISNIRYYFFGGQQAAAAVLNRPMSNSTMIVLLSVLSNIVAVALLILISAIVGAAAAHVSLRDRRRN